MSDERVGAASWQGISWTVPLDDAGGLPPAPPELQTSTVDRFPAQLPGLGAPSSPPAPPGPAPDAHGVSFRALLERVSTSVRTQAGGLSASGQASAEAHAEGGAQVRLGRGTASVDAEVRLGVSASVQGQLSGAGFTLQGEARASAELLARARAYASAGPQGVAAGASAEVRASLMAQGRAELQLAGGLVSGRASGSAEAGAGAHATASVGLSVHPLEASVHLEGGAFAGTRAGFSAQGGALGFQVGVHGEAWAGVGVQAELSVGLHDGKFTFSLGLGVALGVGGFLRIDLEIDFAAIGKAIGDFFKGLFGGAAPPPALDSVGDALRGLFAPRPAPEPEADDPGGAPPLDAGPDPTSSSLALA